MKNSLNELLIYLGILIGLFNTFMIPNILEISKIFWWISGIAVLIFTIPTLIKAYQVIIGK